MNEAKICGYKVRHELNISTVSSFFFVVDLVKVIVIITSVGIVSELLVLLGLGPQVDGKGSEDDEKSDWDAKSDLVAVLGSVGLSLLLPLALRELVVLPM